MKFEIAIVYWQNVRMPIKIGGVENYYTQKEMKTEERYFREIDDSNYDEFLAMEEEAYQKVKALEVKLNKTSVGDYPFVFRYLREIV